MFKKILIANRGEIAVRIIRACRDLDISPVTVYSEADVDAVHVSLADEALCIGPPPSPESYLNIEAIVKAAQRMGAEAIHPGYGFLAENAQFARAVTEAGITFIGPNADAMDIMGSKISARRTAVDAGVPVVPGTVEPLSSVSEARETAQRFGYPVMLKAASGGGGKGMRLVNAEAELESAFQNARSEAAAAFGDSAIYLEKAVAQPRHIEIQVFADSHGNVVHLGERECSIQRRHQKVVEECPSPIGDVNLREQMGKAATKLAAAVNYLGAGTVEFLVSDLTRDFYFLEMNTRLQVEHPVTEMVTGIDLVCEQIKVAAGESLSFRQEDVAWRGHAIECRVYAEDPNNNFLPSPGTISYLRAPAGPGVRDDSGVVTGSQVSIHYDPLISKLAVWGRDRGEALERLARALDEYQITGIKTTLPFFREIVRDNDFIQGRLDTGFISRFQQRQTETKVTDDQINERMRDLAIIAAAIQFRSEQMEHIDDQAGDGKGKSQWKLAGRASQLNASALPQRRK